MARPVNPAGLAGVFANIQALGQGQQRLDIAGQAQGQANIQELFSLVQRANTPEDKQQIMQNFFRQNPDTILKGIKDLQGMTGGGLGAIQPEPGRRVGSARFGAAGEFLGATTEPIPTEKPGLYDVKFYTGKGFTIDEAETIINKKVGLEEPGADRTAKDIAMDISRWQNIYNKTREVGILGTFGDIFDQEMADLATQTLDDLRAELAESEGTEVSGDLVTPPAPPSPQRTVQIPAPSGDVDAITGAERRARPPEPFKAPFGPGTKIKVQLKTGSSRIVTFGTLKSHLNQGATIEGHPNMSAYQNKSGRSQKLDKDTVPAGGWAITFDGGKTWQLLR